MASSIAEMEQRMRHREKDMEYYMRRKEQEMDAYQKKIRAEILYAQKETTRDFRCVMERSDLDHAVFKTPVDTLVNLWTAKYGTDWVNKLQVLDDPFFEWAAMRLRSLGKLEEQSFTEASSRVFMLRIVTGG